MNNTRDPLLSLGDAIAEDMVRFFIAQYALPLSRLQLDRLLQPLECSIQNSWTFLKALAEAQRFDLLDRVSGPATLDLDAVEHKLGSALLPEPDWPNAGQLHHRMQEVMLERASYAACVLYPCLIYGGRTRADGLRMLIPLLNLSRQPGLSQVPLVGAALRDNNDGIQAWSIIPHSTFRFVDRLLKAHTRFGD